MRGSDIRTITAVLSTILLFFILILLSYHSLSGVAPCNVCTSGAANIPEPSTLSLFAVAAPFLFWKLL